MSTTPLNHDAHLILEISLLYPNPPNHLVYSVFAEVGWFHVNLPIGFAVEYLLSAWVMYLFITGGAQLEGVIALITKLTKLR